MTWEQLYSPSPRLQWMQRHRIQVDKVRVIQDQCGLEMIMDDDPLYCYAEPGFRAYCGTLDETAENGVKGICKLALDEQDAIFELAKALRINLWSEEEYLARKQQSIALPS